MRILHALDRCQSRFTPMTLNLTDETPQRLESRFQSEVTSYPKHGVINIKGGDRV